MKSLTSIDLNRLEIFNIVALSESFSKAALQLKQPKSRISRNIAALEKELGVELIYRTTRQFRLTDAGKSLLSRTGPLLGELKSTLEQVSSSADEIAGPIRVTVPEDVGTELMGNICQEFLLTYPKVKLTIYSSNDFVDLVKESVDLALRIGTVRDSTMIQKKIGYVQMNIYSSPEFAEKNLYTNIQSLERVPFLVFSPRGDKVTTLKLTNGREVKQVKLSSQFTSNNFFILRAMAVQGAGVTLLPPFLAQRLLQERKLTLFSKDYKGEAVPIQILIPHQKEIPIRIRKFIEFLSHRVSSYL